MTSIADAARRGRAIAEVSARSGIRPRTVSNLYYKWQKDGRDWRTLANRSKWPDPIGSNVPPAFMAWIKNLNEGNQRATSFRQTYRSCLAVLERWERSPLDSTLRIPGYDTPPERNPFKGYPPGWSYRNLKHFCDSNVFEKAVRRQGPKAASAYLPNVRTTRGPDANGRALEFGEIIYFDDQDHDTYVNLTGVNGRAMRPQSFNALEALSASCFEVGLKPQLWDEAAGKRRELDQLDFFWFVMLCLTKHGYNPHTGTTLIWEHGKANPDKTGLFDEMLLKATNGKVRTDKSGIFRAPEFKAMVFEGQASGNFRFKAPIESFFNLLRNYSASLPAPTGRNRDMAPEESYGLVAGNDRMLKLIDHLPIDAFLRLKREVLEWEDYCRLHRHIMTAIDARRDHALEGWHKLGFTGARYRLGLDKPWIDELEYQMIPAADRDLYRHIVTQPGNNELFQLSPREVFLMRSRQLAKLPMRLVPVLAPERAWSDVTVSSSLEMEITDQWLDSEPLAFIAKVRTPQGYEVLLQRGKTYKRLLNIFDPSKLWIAEREGSRKGAFIGTAERVQPSCKADQEAILKQLGEHKHVRAAESVELHSRMESEAARRVANRQFNRDVTEGRPATPEEKAQARVDRRHLHDIQRRLSDEQRAAVLTTPNEDETAPEISAEAMSKYFGSDVTNQTEGETW